MTNRIGERLHAIRGEFNDVAGLRLTAEEAQARWAMDQAVAQVILDAFVDVGFLRRSGDGAYFRRPDRAIDDG